MSQQALAALLGVSFQQLQKYEKGSNRIGSGRLYEIAVIFKVEPNYFFDEMPPHFLARLDERLRTASGGVDQDASRYDRARELEEQSKDVARLWLSLPNDEARAVAWTFLDYIAVGEGKTPRFKRNTRPSRR